MNLNRKKVVQVSNQRCKFGVGHTDWTYNKELNYCKPEAETLTFSMALMTSLKSTLQRFSELGRLQADAWNSRPGCCN
ncbi:hypothetical protein Mapa_016949 [Marchantia paleacea]|nr:hypothetical protein Mapa_016949 [Marchantia paleacea]